MSEKKKKCIFPLIKQKKKLHYRPRDVKSAIKDSVRLDEKDYFDSGKAMLWMKS